jgi:16S rRNA (guanine(966)-N(2))-methyltransferase RsmD
MRPKPTAPGSTGLRIIAGRYKRRRLQSLPGDATRPMLDRMRETLFNVLQNQIEGKVFADLYAGTGAVGIEALSRGASRAIFVESNPAAVDMIRANLHSVGAQDEARILFSPVAKILPGLQGDIVFLGPPYQAAGEYENTLAALGESGPPLVIAQHDRARPLAERYGRLERYRTIQIGRNALSFYRPRDPSGDS